MVSFFGLVLRLVVGRSGRRADQRARRGGGPAPIALGQYAADVLWIVDGDTVDVRVEGRRLRVRLDSIDCPEDGQAWGGTAKAGLMKMIRGKTVSLEVHGMDGYGRTIATIFVRHGTEPRWVNVNERMVMLGHAWVLRSYYAHLPAERQQQLDRLEAWARSKKVGLWKTENPIPPWNWRRER